MRPLYLFLFVSLALVACEKQPSPTVAEGREDVSMAASSSSPVETAGETVPLGRLPGHVQPTHYRLELTILPSQSRFSGSVRIDLALSKAVDHFYLHGRFLEDVDASLEHEGARWPVQFEQVDPSGVVRVGLPRAVAGAAVLQINYSAPFNESLEALYKVRAGDEDYAFTQFQAISAREAFPGFDEPAFKVPFDISLVVQEQHVAISSTPAVAETSLGNGLKRVDFATSKPLPTYLVAFAVGPFDVVEAEDLPPTQYREQPVPLRGIAAAGRGGELQLALDSTRGILEALESYFATPYPYAKLDLIAVPDFGAGAMENVGAITYRDSILLVAPDARPQIKRRLFRIHAHELAHQWFGNLVTPEWWDDIWLNESFATWISSVALDLWQPGEEYRRDLKQGAARVMDSDSLTTARQIRQPIESNHDIANAFDGITYTKGGAVLSMFEAFLGRETFRAGVQEHMRRHAWETATALDFIDALASQSTEYPPEAVAAAFRSFIEQPGLPMLEARLSCDQQPPQVRLRQSRYLPLGSTGNRAQTWKLPVCLDYRSGASTMVQCLILEEPEQDVTLTGAECPDLLLPNAGGFGYFRWSLDEAGWAQLLAQDEHLAVDELMSVAASLDGAFDAGTVDVPTFLQVAKRLSANDNYLVATAPLGQLEFIHQQLADEPQRALLSERFETIYGDTLDRVGLARPRDNEAAEMQSLVTDFMAVRARLPELRESLQNMAWEYVGYPDRPGVHAQGMNDNLIGTALAVAVQEDGADTPFARHLEQVLRSSQDAVFRSRALSALGYAEQSSYRDRLLALTLSNELRDNEFYLPLARQLAEEATRDATWAWLQENLDAVLARVPEWNKGGIARYGRYFCDPDRRQDVEAYFGPLVGDLQGGPRALAGALEGIDLCVAKTEHHRPGLARYLEQ
jgi:alanyl aminopeptidase